MLPLPLSFLPPRCLTSVTNLSLFCQQGADNLCAMLNGDIVVRGCRLSIRWWRDWLWLVLCVSLLCLDVYCCLFGRKKVLPQSDIVLIIESGHVMCTLFPEKLTSILSAISKYYVALQLCLIRKCFCTQTFCGILGIFYQHLYSLLLHFGCNGLLLAYYKKVYCSLIWWV